MEGKKTKTKAQIADEYGVSGKTFYLYLKKMGFYQKYPESKWNKTLLPPEIEFIYQKLDKPNE